MNNNTEDFSEKLIITTMEQELKKLGNQKCYEVIQNFPNPRTRARYLHFFIQAGGFVPETDFLIEKNGNLFINNKEE